jgi:hypothetical protein
VNYIQIAKDNALKNLASEININVSGEVISKVVEKSGISKEEIKSEIITSTSADLEGYEVVGTFEDKNNYWIYYRLSKELYEQKKREKTEKALKLALDLFSKAKEYEKNNNIGNAISFYLQALKPLEKYIAEPLQIEYQGKNIYITNEIYFSIQNILSEVRLVPLNKKIKAKIGRPVNKTLKLSAKRESFNGKTEVANFPLLFSFIKGSGEIVSHVKTDINGIAGTEITKITSPEKLQIVKAEFDISAFVNEDSTSFVYRDILKSFPTPETKFILHVSGLSIYIETNEKMIRKMKYISRIKLILYFEKLISKVFCLSITASSKPIIHWPSIDETNVNEKVTFREFRKSGCLNSFE